MERRVHGRTVVAGAGDTGLACALHLHRHGVDAALADTRAAPPGLEAVRRELPEAEVRLGGFDREWFEGAVELVLSPGVSPHEPAVAAAAARGVPVLGEIELFARMAQAPVAAVTGTNGKSTVSAWVHAMALADGRRAALGGNFGPPALSLLGEAPELYVLELSSFQLETTRSLRPRVAALLNVSPDHLDRHGGMEAYRAAKLRVFRGAETAVLGRGDPWLAACAAGLARQGLPVVTFGADRGAGERDFGLVEEGGRRWLARGDERWLEAGALALPGGQNVLNALAAMAVADAAGIRRAAIVEALAAFEGLAHRCEPVGEVGGVRWYDDSKGTNVGAAVAAVNGFEEPLVLIAGGDGKGADFGPLAETLRARGERLRGVVLLGRDGPAIRRLVAGYAAAADARDMREAVAKARSFARAGDVVLLSPACASWDMYRDYRERGAHFRAAVRALESGTEPGGANG